MEMSREMLAATVALPATILVVSTVAGSTATITGADRNAVRRAVYVTGGVLIGSAIVSGHIPLVIATIIAVATVIGMTHPHLSLGNLYPGSV